MLHLQPRYAEATLRVGFGYPDILLTNQQKLAVATYNLIFLNLLSSCLIPFNSILLFPF